MNKPNGSNEHDRGSDNAASAFLPQYESARGRAKVILVALMFCSTLDAVAVLSDLSERNLLRRFETAEYLTPELEMQADDNDARQSLIGIAQMVLLIPTAVVFLVWWHRAYRNLHTFGDTQPRWSPGWAVGYWFVPVYCLFRPYQIGKELWIGSTPARAMEFGSRPNYSESTWLVSLWWAAWILLGIYGQFVFRQSLGHAARAPSIIELLEWNEASIFLNVGDVFKAILAMAVVYGITKRQDAKAASARLATIGLTTG